MDRMHGTPGAVVGAAGSGGRGLVLASALLGMLLLVGCERGGDADEAASGAGAAADSIPSVTLTEFAGNPAGRTGQLIRLTDVAVASRMGEQAFWTEFPNGVPFLIKLDSAMVTGGAQFQSGQRVTVVGRVHTMTDSVKADWQRRGAVSEAQRPEVDFATAFIEASDVRPATVGARRP